MFNFSIDTVSTATSLSTYESYHPCNGKSHECSGSVVVPSRSLLTDLDAKFERDPRSLRGLPRTEPGPDSSANQLIARLRENVSGVGIAEGFS